MRLSLLIAGLAIMAAGGVADDAAAQRVRATVIFGDFQPDRDVGNPQIAATQARDTIRSELERFLGSLATLQFPRQGSGDIVEISARLGVLRDSPGTLTIGSITVGTNQGSRFENVHGVVREASWGSHNLELYQLIVGYELLLRAWQQDRAITAPRLVQALNNHIRARDNGLTRRSNCWRLIGQAVRYIEEKLRTRAPAPQEEELASARQQASRCR